MSSPQDARFPPSARLHRPTEFKRVLKAGRRKSDACFTVLSLPNDTPYPRLGVVAARRNVRLAVGRNRIKRCVRESFRQLQSSLPDSDIVVIVRREADKASRAELYASLARHWQQL